MDLLKEIQQVASDHGLASSTRTIISKYMLALDAVKQINDQGVQSSDLYMLMNLVLFTLSGQFAVPNAFVISNNHDEPGEQPVFLGVGDFENSTVLNDPDFATELSRLPFAKHNPIRIQDMDQTEATSDAVETLLANGIELLVPMSSGDLVIGIAGLGQKVNGKPISDEDIVLLAAIMDAIVPILSLRINEFFDVFHSTVQAVFILAPDFTIQKVNKAAVALLDNQLGNGQGLYTLYGRSLSEVFPVSIFPNWVKAMTNTTSYSSVRHIRNLEICQHGLTQFFEAFLTKINSRRSSSYSLMLTLEDVTEKRASGQRLAHLQSAAEKGQMLSSIAHELNNYLGLLVGGLDLTNHAAKAGDLEKVRERIENLQTTCGSITQFISELVGKRRHESHKSLSCLNSVVGHCLTFVKVQDRFHGIDLQLQLAEELPLTLIDEAEILQLLLNLLNNAADAIKEIKDNGVIQIRTSSSGHYVHLEIEDNGPGIAPEFEDKLFKENLTTKKSGHGFGLTVCAQILKNHDAKYSIESKFGKGAIFKFSFPVHP